jgi:hypothetical protein
MFIRLNGLFVTHNGTTVEVRAAVKNCEFWKLPVLVATQVQTLDENTNVFVPKAAFAGLMIPVLGLIMLEDMPV